MILNSEKENFDELILLDTTKWALSEESAQKMYIKDVKEIELEASYVIKFFSLYRATSQLMFCFLFYSQNIFNITATHVYVGLFCVNMSLNI